VNASRGPMFDKDSHIVSQGNIKSEYEFLRGFAVVRLDLLFEGRVRSTTASVASEGGSPIIVSKMLPINVTDTYVSLERYFS
jgi:hypothetical protein